MQVLANVRSTAGVEGETGTAHMKQCFLAFRPLILGEAMALTHYATPVSKQKSHLQLPRRSTPQRGEACVNGFRVLPTTTTSGIYQTISGCVNTLGKKKWPQLRGHKAKEKQRKTQPSGCHHITRNALKFQALLLQNLQSPTSHHASRQRTSAPPRSAYAQTEPYPHP